MGEGSSCVRRVCPGWRWMLWGVLFVAALSGGLYVRWRTSLLAARLAAETNHVPLDTSRGVLVIAGGGMLPHGVKERFWQLAGGPAAHLVVIPAAAMDPGQARQYEDRWDDFATASIQVLHAECRSQANAPEFSRCLETATGVWLGGGTQTWLTGNYRSTLVHERLQQVLQRGGVIGGTSAGAAVMSDIMIAGGRRDPVEGRGFGFAPDTIIDQHFLKRNRLHRLCKLLEKHPGCVGLGVDERTALIIELNGCRLSVVGDSYVVACVPARDQQPPRYEFLKPGDRTDLASLRSPDTEVDSPWDLDSLLLGED